MSDLRVIKEPIHNYIAVSELEHALINDPLFLRLQHISQNGLAFLTYPSNRTSRFIHSLGAMHLGGEMIRSAVFNSDRSERDAFMRAFGEVLSEAESNVNVRLDQIGKWLAEQNDACYRHNAFDPKDPNSVPLIILFQSVRIACVMHDLGHPPISHTTEGVMKSMLDSFRIEGPVQVTYKEFVDALTGIGKERPADLEMGEYVMVRTVGPSVPPFCGAGFLCCAVAWHLSSPLCCAHPPPSLGYALMTAQAVL